MEQIEDKGCNALAMSAFSKGRLQALECASPFLVQDDCFHVEYRTLGLQFFHGGGDGWKLRGPIEAVAGAQADGAVCQVTEQPVAIELNFVHPAIALGRGVHQRGQLHGIVGFHQRRQFVASGDGVHGTSRLDTRPQLVEKTSGIAVRPGFGVVRFDQQPVFLFCVFCVAAHADEIPIALQPLPVQGKGEMAFLQPGVRVALGFPASFVPQHDRAPAVLPLRDGPLEIAIGKRMVFGSDSQTLGGGVEAWPARDRPAQQNAVEFQAEIVMKAGGVVLLDQVG